MNSSQFKKLALSFPEATEEPHFERVSFRIRKKIFATLDEKAQLANLKLNEVDQSVFSEYNLTAIYPVPNKWGKKGWTIIDLSKVKTSLVKDALTCAYCEVAPQKLADQFSR